MTTKKRRRGAGGVASSSLTSFAYVTANSRDGSNVTSYTFSGQSIGTADADRVVIVHCSGWKQGGGQTGFASVTIAGVTATEIVSYVEPGFASDTCGIFAAAVPSGTTGDIVITYDLSNASFGIAIYRMINPDGVAAHDTDFVDGDNSTCALSIDTLEDGAIVMGSASTTASTTSGGTEDDERDMRSNEWTSASSSEPTSFGAGTAISRAAGKIAVGASW